jgi:hypothetical protein
MPLNKACPFLYPAKISEAAKEPIYYSSNVSEGSFYEAYDPFEYMVTKAQQLQTDEDQVSMLKATFLHY